MDDDGQLLQAYARDGAREALDTLVRKHLDLVYSAALRQVRHAHLAEDVTQAVFLILAKRAPTIRTGMALGGWLLAVTRRAAVDAMRKEMSDRRRDAAAARFERVREEDAGSTAQWEELAPVLDGALEELPPHDRDAVVLRVLENQSLNAVGRALGISEDAAGKRVGRALTRLRKVLRRRGVAVPAAGLAGVLASQAVQAAPTAVLSGTLAATATGIASPSVLALVKAGLSALTAETAKMAAALALPLVAMLVFGVVFFGWDPAQGADGAGRSITEIRAVRLPPAGSRPPAARAGAPETVLPSIFATDDWFTGSNYVAARTGTAADTIVSRYGGNRYLSLRMGSTKPLRLIVDGVGNLYAAGETWDDLGQLHGIVRERRRGESQWRTIFDSGPNRVDSVSGLAVNPSGGLYAGAFNSLAGGWYVYFRPPGQEAFLDQPVDHIPSDQPGMIAGIVVDDVGDVYVAGDMSGHWIVRKQTRGVGEFATVDDFTADSSLMGKGKRPVMAQDIAVVHGGGPSAGLYVCGRRYKPSGVGNSTKLYWTVRRSRDGGRSWEMADDYWPDDGGGFWRAHMPSAVYGDAQGAVYVTGAVGAKNAPVSDGPNHWLTRRSATGDLGTWTDDDNYVLAGDYPYAVGQAIAADRAGNVYVGGVAAGEGGSNCHGIIRTNAGGYWHTLDDFNPLANRAAWTALAVDNEGRLWSAGWVQGSNPGWIVRSAMLPGTVAKDKAKEVAGGGRP